MEVLAVGGVGLRASLAVVVTGVLVVVVAVVVLELEVEVELVPVVVIVAVVVVVVVVAVGVVVVSPYSRHASKALESCRLWHLRVPSRCDQSPASPDALERRERRGSSSFSGAAKRLNPN